MDAGHFTVGRISWWFERGSMLLAVALAATLYVVAIAKAELSLPSEVQLEIFESQHGLLWADGRVIPDALSLQAAVALQQHLP